MKTTLYYFSGTGNSLKIAMDLADRLQNTELIPMAKLWQQDRIVADTERVGFVFPIYFFGQPDIVLEFVKKVELEKASYVFAVITRGGTFFGSAVYRLQTLLKKKARTLNAAFKINMPDNYIPLKGSRSEEKQKEIFERAEKKTDEIAEIVKGNENKVENDIFPFKQIFLFINNWCLGIVHGWDKKFYADDKCNFCGICEKICPVGNITLIEGKPQWQHRCQQCMACIQFCPEKAIQYGSKTIKRKRYHHPDIKVKDMIRGCQDG